VEPEGVLEDLTAVRRTLAAWEGVRDPVAIESARQAVLAATAAERAWRRAVGDRDEALRAAVAANPDAGWQGLARVIGAGLTANTLRAAIRRGDPLG
jgi:transcriptional/translational regulatory protein YebC/TACO1